MKLVIIESPYAGNVVRNTRYLRSCIRECINRGESPYASHRMLTDALDDNDPVERAVGIKAGLAWRRARRAILQDDTDPSIGVLRHDLVEHIFYVDLGWSGGMIAARSLYDQEGITYEERTLPPDDPFFTPAIDSPELTKDELTMLSVFTPNLACVIERGPPSSVEETYKRAREELAWLIRGARLTKAKSPQGSERDIDIDDGC